MISLIKILIFEVIEGTHEMYNRYWTNPSVHFLMIIYTTRCRVNKLGLFNVISFARLDKASCRNSYNFYHGIETSCIRLHETFNLFVTK